MSDTMTEWIAAYFDGELTSERRAWVEDHLAGCADCRRELADLQAMSALLHASPLPRSRTSDKVFSAEVLRRLPHSQTPLWTRMLHSGLRFAPLGLFGLWAFFQAVITVSGAIMFLIGWFPSTSGALSALAPGGGLPLDPGYLSWLQFFTLPLYTSIVEWLAWLSPLILLQVGSAIVFSILFLAWLVGFWSHQRALVNVTE